MMRKAIEIDGCSRDINCINGRNHQKESIDEEHQGDVRIIYDIYICRHGNTCAVGYVRLAASLGTLLAGHFVYSVRCMAMLSLCGGDRK